MGPPLTRAPAWCRTGPEAGKCLDVLCGQSRHHTPGNSQEFPCCVLQCNTSVLDPNPAEVGGCNVGVTPTQSHPYITKLNIFVVIFLDRERSWNGSDIIFQYDFISDHQLWM